MARMKEAEETRRRQMEKREEAERLRKEQEHTRREKERRQREKEAAEKVKKEKEAFERLQRLKEERDADESADGGAKDNEGSSRYNIDIPEELKYVLVNISFGFQLVVI